MAGPGLRLRPGRLEHLPLLGPADEAVARRHGQRAGHRDAEIGVEGRPPRADPSRRRTPPPAPASPSARPARWARSGRRPGRRPATARRGSRGSRPRSARSWRRAAVTTGSPKQSPSSQLTSPAASPMRSASCGVADVTSCWMATAAVMASEAASKVAMTPSPVRFIDPPVVPGDDGVELALVPREELVGRRLAQPGAQGSRAHHVREQDRRRRGSTLGQRAPRPLVRSDYRDPVRPAPIHLRNGEGWS